MTYLDLLWITDFFVDRAVWVDTAKPLETQAGEEKRTHDGLFLFLSPQPRTAACYGDRFRLHLADPDHSAAFLSHLSDNTVL